MTYRSHSPPQALTALLPPKREDTAGNHTTVDDAKFEESDMVDVRSRSFPAGPDFFDFSSQFGGGNESDWEDDDDGDHDEDHDDDDYRQAECQTQ